VLDVIADYFQKRVKGGLKHLQATGRPDRGARIWKFYNFTFIVKTPSHALFINCRDGGMRRKISAIDPELIIPGHENEIRHIVDGRQGVVRTLSNLGDNKIPVVLMTRGEHFYYGSQ
jgi:hypothetical protein